MHKNKAHIILGILLTTVLPLFAKKSAKPVAISTEQEQQFTYYWYAARHAINQERYSDAYVLLEFCHALKPEDAQTLYYLGVMYQGLHKDREAQEFFERAYRVQKNHHSEELLNHLEQIYWNQENWKKALKIQDELDQVKGYDAMSAITRYRIHASARQPKKALKAIDDYLATDPDNIRFMLFRIDVLEHLGAKTRQLYEAYERVLELDPYNLTILNNYAWMLATHKGDLSKAEQMSAITIHEQPGNPTFLDTYGWIMHLKGQDELALFYLNRALWNATIDKNKQEIIKHIEVVKSEK